MLRDLPSDARLNHNAALARARAHRVRWRRTVRRTAFAAALAGLCLAAKFAPERVMRLVDFDAAAASLGFGLDQVSLTGQHFTADSDVFDALDLANVRSIVSFDAKAVRSRLERLPWIATAELTRIYPGGLDVRITERKPFAVWTRGGRNYLIDNTGRVLSPVGDSARLELPHVAGEGAAAAAADLLSLLAGYPAIASRVEEAERVAERRWTLKLSRGVRLVLPADGETAALEEIARGGDLSRLVEGEKITIDLRARGRLAVRALGTTNGKSGSDTPRS